MIKVITLEREYGSGGADIARRLAERLGWKLWDQALTDEIARLMDCSSRTVQEREERRDTFTYRLFKSFMRGSFEGSLNEPRLNMVDADCIRKVAQKVVVAAADQGNAVIVGRGSAYYLFGRPDTLHVFVYAPFEEKVRRLVKTGKSEKEAAELSKRWTGSARNTSRSISMWSGQLGITFTSWSTQPWERKQPLKPSSTLNRSLRNTRHDMQGGVMAHSLTGRSARLQGSG
jgi:cytidylate kinase